MASALACFSAARVSELAAFSPAFVRVRVRVRVSGVLSRLRCGGGGVGSYREL